MSTKPLQTGVVEKNPNVVKVDKYSYFSAARTNKNLYKKNLMAVSGHWREGVKIEIKMRETKPHSPGRL